MQESGSGTDVAEKVCPKCAGKLVQRKSKFGAFVGCGNYPQCKHIERK